MHGRSGSVAVSTMREEWLRGRACPCGPRGDTVRVQGRRRGQQHQEVKPRGALGPGPYGRLLGQCGAEDLAVSLAPGCAGGMELRPWPQAPAA